MISYVYIFFITLSIIQSIRKGVCMKARNGFIEYIKKEDFKSAAQLLQDCNVDEIAQHLEHMYKAVHFKVNSISVLKRKLKDDASYNDFYHAWLPPLDKQEIKHTNTGAVASYFPFSTRVINAVNVADEQEIISIGLMSATKQEIEDLQHKQGKQNKSVLKTESVRHDEIEDVAVKIGQTQFFVCKDDNMLG